MVRDFEPLKDNRRNCLQLQDTNHVEFQFFSNNFKISINFQMLLKNIRFVHQMALLNRNIAKNKDVATCTNSVIVYLNRLRRFHFGVFVKYLVSFKVRKVGIINFKKLHNNYFIPRGRVISKQAFLPILGSKNQSTFEEKQVCIRHLYLLILCSRIILRITEFERIFESFVFDGKRPKTFTCK